MSYIQLAITLWAGQVVSYRWPSIWVALRLLGLAVAISRVGASIMWALHPLDGFGYHLEGDGSEAS